VAECKVLTEAAAADAAEEVDRVVDEVYDENTMLDAFAEETVLEYRFEKEELEEHVRTECTNVLEFPEEDLVDCSTVINGSYL
jgi:hypothetical protein